MANITRYYGISEAVEFLDVDLSTDNRLFLDPRVLRLQRGTFAAGANTCTATFFDEIVTCVKSRKQSDKVRGRELLQRFTEPKETRLGFSKAGIDGHGSAEGIGEAIWNALSTDLEAFVRVGILKLLEDVPVFVDNVAQDRTSDLTTRIVFEPLARFTQSMVATHPEFTRNGHRTEAFERQIWDPDRLQWRDQRLVLPIAYDQPLILVPRDWARPRLLMSSGRYFETVMLSFAQDQEATIDNRTGKVQKPLKRSLKERREFARGIDTLIRVTWNAHEFRADLLERFRNFVDDRYEPLSDDELARHIH